MSPLTCHSWHVTSRYYSWLATLGMSLQTCHSSLLTLNMTHSTCKSRPVILNITCPSWHITLYMSLSTCYSLHATLYMSLLTCVYHLCVNLVRFWNFKLFCHWLTHQLTITRPRGAFAPKNYGHIMLMPLWPFLTYSQNGHDVLSIYGHTHDIYECLMKEWSKCR